MSVVDALFSMFGEECSEDESTSLDDDAFASLVDVASLESVPVDVEPVEYSFRLNATAMGKIL